MFNFRYIITLFQLIFSIKELDLMKYQGRWYQVYGNRFDQTFEKYSKCITADYTINSNSTMSVLNSQLTNTNHLEQINGYVYYKNEIDAKNNQGKLRVHLDNVKHDAPYWIVNIGPVINNYYDWAIVSDPSKLSLFVLTRNVDRFYSNYNDEVEDILYNYGYDNLIETSHENCTYVPEPYVFTL
jgi:lipocalin